MSVCVFSDFACMLLIRVLVGSWCSFVTGGILVHFTGATHGWHLLRRDQLRSAILSARS
jgi:hypothetical protein